MMSNMLTNGDLKYSIKLEAGQVEGRAGNQNYVAGEKNIKVVQREEATKAPS